jgi:hypothetical protein
MNIMRRALPNQRFEVTIEPAPAALAGGDESEGSPQRIVTVLTEARLTDAEMESVSSALRSADVVDGASGGTLAFRIGPPSMFEALPAPVVSATADTRDRAQAQSANLSAFLWFGLAGILVLAAAFFAMRFFRPRPVLDAAEHDKFAEQLKAALQAQESEAQNA